MLRYDRKVRSAPSGISAQVDRNLQNYMTVPAAIRKLEKIEIVRHIDHEYSMDYAVTATQKSILKAFDLAEANVRKQAAGINEDLKSCNTKEA